MPILSHLPQKCIRASLQAAKDLTRVAWLNPYMWAELFLSNKQNVLSELRYYIESLQAYEAAIANNDEDLLVSLLDEGRKRKEEVDG